MSKSAQTVYVESLTDDKCDPELGRRVRSRLSELGLEQITKPKAYEPQQAVKDLQQGIEGALRHLGLDTKDPSLKDTPKRFACMVVGELTKGLNYDFFPKCTATPNGMLENYWRVSGCGDCEVTEGTEGAWMSQRYRGRHDQMVLVKDIQAISLCEHHLQTIDGTVHIAYIPRTQVLGLSKFARVADFFARRPQIQERMTDQIYYALELILETSNIGIVVDATHYCMKARGAMQHSSRTQTNKMGGVFMSKPALRQEFLDAIR